MIFQGTKNELLREVEREALLRTSDATRAATVLNNAKFSVLRTDGQTVVVKIADDNQFDLIFSFSQQLLT